MKWILGPHRYKKKKNIPLTLSRLRIRLKYFTLRMRMKKVNVDGEYGKSISPYMENTQITINLRLYLDEVSTKIKNTLNLTLLSLYGI